MLRLVLLGLCLAWSAGHAQTAADYSRMMEALSGIESRLLDQQSALRAAETTTADPIWTRDSTGAYRVVSGDDLRGKVESLVYLAQTLDLDDAALAQLPYATQLAASLISDNMAANMAVERIMHALRESSLALRRDAMQGLDAAITQTQSDFSSAMQARDALLSGDATPAFDTGLCGQPQPDNATVYAWTAGGPANFYWDAGGVLCDTYYNRVVVVTGDRLVLFKCQDAGRTNCERQRTIYQFTERDGALQWGRTFLSDEDFLTDAASGGFHWRQCRPAIEGSAPC